MLELLLNLIIIYYKNMGNDCNMCKNVDIKSKI